MRVQIFHLLIFLHRNQIILVVIGRMNYGVYQTIMDRTGEVTTPHNLNIQFLETGGGLMTNLHSNSIGRVLAHPTISSILDAVSTMWVKK